MSCLGARGGALQQANEIQQGETPTADNSDLSSLITENSNLKFGFEMIQTQCQNLQCSSANCSVVPTLCDPTEYSVHGILQARILEWEPLPCPGRSSPPRDWTQVSRTAGGFFTSWATREAQECWSGSPSPLQGVFLTRNQTGDSHIAGGFFTNWAIREAHNVHNVQNKI